MIPDSRLTESQRVRLFEWQVRLKRPATSRGRQQHEVVKNAHPQSPEVRPGALLHGVQQLH
jgi:hypothetical protein